MITLSEVIDGYTAAKVFDSGTLGRLAYWREALGHRPLTDISEMEVDEAITRLVQRGGTRTKRNGTPVPTGKPLKGSTVNRYIVQLQSLFKYARRARLVSRSWTPPTTGIEKAPEPSDPNRFLTTAEVDRLVAAARVADRNWKKLPALIRLLADTGLRSGNAIALRWRDVDLAARTATVKVTKNGAPHVAVLSERVVRELMKLPGSHHPDAYVFANAYGQPYHFKKLFRKAAAMAGLPTAFPHLLRHSCGAALSAAGVNQASIMLHMGHKSLGASARYLHLSLADRRSVADSVFA